MHSFQQTSIHTLIPELKKQCRFRGLFCALDLQKFTDAYYAICDLAKQKGSRHLPKPLSDELDHWIAASILAGLAEFAPASDNDQALSKKIMAQRERSLIAWMMAA